jgi:hypothetical protein
MKDGDGRGEADKEEKADGKGGVRPRADDWRKAGIRAHQTADGRRWREAPVRSQTATFLSKPSEILTVSIWNRKFWTVFVNLGIDRYLCHDERPIIQKVDSHRYRNHLWEVGRGNDISFRRMAGGKE